MARTDPVADMFSVMRNAITRYYKKAVVDHSKFKEAILNVLKEEGYILDYKVIEQPQIVPKKAIHIYLKYGPEKEKVLRRIQRISKPGRRIFVPHDKIPKVLDGLGMVILSTSKGVLSSRRAKSLKVGGELLARVY
jgi:small subunit ribosomal protein S8